MNTKINKAIFFPHYAILLTRNQIKEDKSSQYCSISAIAWSAEGYLYIKHL